MAFPIIMRMHKQCVPGTLSSPSSAPGNEASHLYVACWSICNWDQDLRLAKSVLDHLIGPWSLDFFYRSKVKGQIVATRSWPLILAVWRSLWSLDQLSKSALIAWFHFDPGRKHFYTGHISDYPLSVYTSTPSHLPDLHFNFLRVWLRDTARVITRELNSTSYIADQ